MHEGSRGGPGDGPEHGVEGNDEEGASERQRQESSGIKLKKAIVVFGYI